MTTPNVSGTTGLQVVADINVQSCAPAAGRQGQSQWMLTTDVPWSRYPERFWIDAVQGALPVSPGQHHCVFTVGRLKPNSLGDAPFHYRFTLNSIDFVGSGYPDIMTVQFAPAGAPPPPTSGTPLQPGGLPSGGPSREQSIIRQSSMKAVMDAKVAAYNNATKLVSDGHLIPDDNVTIAELIMLHAEGMVTNMLMGSTPAWVDYMVGIINETHKQLAEEDGDGPDPDA
jgi:hypothetical protein